MHLQECVERGLELPMVTWLGAFFHPQSFLTAILQTHAREQVSVHPHTHTHTHTHTYAHLHIYKHTHAHVHTYINAHACTHKDIQTQVHTHTHLYTHAHTYTHLCMRDGALQILAVEGWARDALALTYTQAHARTYTHIYSLTHSLTHSLVHSPTVGQLVLELSGFEHPIDQLVLELTR